MAGVDSALRGAAHHDHQVRTSREQAGHRRRAARPQLAQLRVGSPGAIQARAIAGQRHRGPSGIAASGIAASGIRLGRQRAAAGNPSPASFQARRAHGRGNEQRPGCGQTAAATSTEGYGRAADGRHAEQ